MLHSKKLLIGASIALASVSAFAADAPRIDGKWFAYPGQVDPLERTIDPPRRSASASFWRRSRRTDRLRLYALHP